jgi:hypothetical protein
MTTALSAGARTRERAPLGDEIEHAILHVLGRHLRNDPTREPPGPIIHRQAQMLAEIALTNGGPIRPFLKVGTKRTRAELKRIVRAKGRKAYLDIAVRKLHAPAIDLLGDVGWTRDRLIHQSNIASEAAIAALKYLSAKDELISVDMKPIKLKALGMMRMLKWLFEEVTGQRATYSDSGVFLNMIREIQQLSPSRMEWGNVNGLARKAIMDRGEISGGNFL